MTIAHQGLTKPDADSQLSISLSNTSSQVDGELAGAIQDKLDELELLANQLADGDSYDIDCDLDLDADFLLSIVVPVYNEEKTIRGVVAKLMQLPIPSEIILIDDGSTDDTANVLLELGALPNLRVVLKAKNGGKGSAVRAGFERANGNILLIQDADLEYDPQEIPKLLRPIISNEADVVYGSRFRTQSMSVGSSWWHRFGNRALTTLSNFTTGLRLTDMETCYKVFRREAITGVELQQNRFGIEPEVTAKMARRGFRIKELPIHYQARDWHEGKKIGIMDGLAAIYCILRYGLWD